MAATSEYASVTGTRQFSVLPVLNETCVFSRGDFAGVFPPTALCILKHEVVDTFDSVLDADLTSSLTLPYDYSIF